MRERKTAGKLTDSLITIFLLALCLCITTAALVYTSISVENNRFKTGQVQINLNDGLPVIREQEFRFEPGMTVVKEFFIENDSTWDVYYRLYPDQASGVLADVLNITVKDGETVLYTGLMSGWTRQSSVAAENVLKVGQRRYLTAEFYYPEKSGNDTQDADLSFVLFAEATQAKNNPGRQFSR